MIKALGSLFQFVFFHSFFLFFALQFLSVCYLMCKVCRLWGVLSQKFLFCYACRPNFHHKYLTLSDPPLSACGEALISRHTCADRPEILKLEPRMRMFSHVRVGALVHVGAKRQRTLVSPSDSLLPLLHLAAEGSHRCWRASLYLSTDSVVSVNSALLSGSFLLSSSQVRWGKESQRHWAVRVIFITSGMFM